MIKIIKKIQEIFKNIIKEKFLKGELDSVVSDINILTKKIINLKTKIASIEKDNEELKIVVENLSMAYLDLAKTLITGNQKTYSEKSVHDDYLDQMLKLFNSEQNDDDLIN
jgi:regulator of replication initiation timing